MQNGRLYRIENMIMENSHLLIFDHIELANYHISNRRKNFPIDLENRNILSLSNYYVLKSYISLHMKCIVFQPIKNS